MKRVKYLEVGQYLVVDPRVCHGKLTFKGTRVPVQTVLYWMSQGKTIDSVVSDWPELKREAVEEAVQLASAALVEQALTAARNGS